LRILQNTEPYLSITCPLHNNNNNNDDDDDDDDNNNNNNNNNNMARVKCKNK